MTSPSPAPLTEAGQLAYVEIYNGAHNTDHSMLELKPGATCKRCESTARAVVSAVEPILAKELHESADLVYQFAQSRPTTSAEAKAIFDGIATSLSLPASKETQQ